MRTMRRITTAPGATVLFCILLIILSVSSCATTPTQSPLMEKVSEDPTLSAKQLRILLNEFVFWFAGRTEEAADEIILTTSSAEAQRSALQWKIYAIPACFRSASIEDPLAAVIDSWVLAKQMVYFFETGPGKGSFGAQQVVALGAVRKIEEEISKIAAAAGAREESIVKVGKWADSLARENPFDSFYFTRRSFLMTYSRFLEKDGAGLFKSIAGLNEGLSVLKDLLVMYAENMPNQARWQAELLLNDTRLWAASAQLRESLSRATLTASRLSEISLDLPAKLDKGREVILGDLHREWYQALNDIDELRLDTLDRISGERVAFLKAIDQEVTLVLEQVSAEREIVLRDIEEVSLRISDEMFHRGTQTAERLLMRAFWLGVALGFVVFALVMAGAFILRRGKQVTAAK